MTRSHGQPEPAGCGRSDKTCTHRLEGGWIVNRPTLFDLVTGEIALSIISPPVWIVTDAELARVLDDWQKYLP